ncbi:MAG: glutamate synthase domain-containing protein 2 [Saprospiraceae bacterium]|jgi:glutamate synthase domain-containing protein 2
MILLILFGLVLITGLLAFFVASWIWFITALCLVFFGIGLYDYFQVKHSIKRNFPFVGQGRYLADWLRPKIYQYFVEPDTEGRPFNRLRRSIVYQRAKKALDTAPFGTQLDVYSPGYEWMNHSISAARHNTHNHEPRVQIGGPECKQPYNASLLNVSAMSYGSLSQNAIMALNGGAQIGNFAHNTGEGGISEYHNKNGGDLIYQLGTGYFGSRGPDGKFFASEFQKRASASNVKMIELKLSQGAKPGHGGILPGKKVTKKISEIRGVPIGQDVLSPPSHAVFSTPTELLQFIEKLRVLSGGKPVGFKLCIGNKSEFLAICKAMVATNKFPDFISIDGGEGGTGAAPLEFSNSVGMPLKEGLAFAYDALMGFEIKEHITLIAAGKIVTGFDIFRALALGADVCYSARAMMMALGCIQALECNKNTCPVGVTTNDPHLMRGLVVSDKKERVAAYHKETIHSFMELLAASGLEDPRQINRGDINRRIEMNVIQRYDEIYPYITKGSLLSMQDCPDDWKRDLSVASEQSFRALFEEALEN